MTCGSAKSQIRKKKYSIELQRITYPRSPENTLGFRLIFDGDQLGPSDLVSDHKIFFFDPWEDGPDMEEEGFSNHVFPVNGIWLLLKPII